MCLPPSTEAFELNVQRAHIQTAIWEEATKPDPPPLDPIKHGWICDDISKSLVPRTLPAGTCLAPPEILELIRCGVASDNPCLSAKC